MTHVESTSKITPRHLARKAVVYLRQSSLAQVKHNTEGQRLQDPQHAPPNRRLAGAKSKGRTGNKPREKTCGGHIARGNCRPGEWAHRVARQTMGPGVV